MLARLETSVSMQKGTRKVTWGIYRFTLDFREFLREIEIRGSAPVIIGTAIECQILYRPLNENENRLWNETR